MNIVTFKTHKGVYAISTYAKAVNRAVFVQLIMRDHISIHRKTEGVTLVSPGRAFYILRHSIATSCFLFGASGMCIYCPHSPETTPPRPGVTH